MADHVTVPAHELHGMSKLLDKQAEHYVNMSTYVWNYCNDTEGMTNLMSALVGPMDDLAYTVASTLHGCERGISETAWNVRDADQLLHGTDAYSAFTINSLCSPYAGSYREIRGSDVSRLPGGYLPGGSYGDVWDDPAKPADDVDDIGKDLEDLKGPLGRYEHIWSQLGANVPSADAGSLIGTLITPLTGNYAHIAYIAQAYGNLGGAMYQIAANERRGTLMLAPRWDGEAATAFEYHMFCWNMGTGGLGDLYKEVSKAIQQVHDDVAALVRQAINGIQRLIDQALSKMADILQWYANSVADLSSGRCTTRSDKHDYTEFFKLVARAVRIIKGIVVTIGLVKKAYDRGAKAIQHLRDLKQKATKFAKDPGGAVQDLVNKQYTKVVDLETNKGWQPFLGMWRVGMLPTAG